MLALSWFSPSSSLTQSGPPAPEMVSPTFRVSLYPSVKLSQTCPDSNPDIVIKGVFFF